MKMEDLKEFASLKHKDRIVCEYCGHIYDGTVFSLCTRCACLNK
jgi:redox-regulated HSP33 family molecular chaperone